jgi:expansin (peptidoglycan-binding protein)
MVTETIPQLKTLSLAKKRRLIAELLDEVFGAPVQERTVAAALTARVAHYRRNPGSARSWAAVKTRLRRKK